MKCWILAPFFLALALPAAADDGKIVFASNRAGNPEIFSINPDGTGATNLTQTPGVSEDVPSLSPDASKVVYQREDNIWFMNADGSGQTGITVGHFPASPSFRNNTDLISYGRFGGFDYDIYTIKPDGTNETRIVNNALGDYYPRWNNDGTKVAYYSHPGTSTPYIYIANADGSGQKQITVGGGDRAASWSPDGGCLVFQSDRSGNNEIYMINADGTNEIRLTNNPANDTAPTFSPDGSKIAFGSDRSGNNDIYVMNVDGTNVQNITNNSASDTAPSWQQTISAGAPSASISNVTVAEGNSGSTNATFTISLSAPSASSIKVTYRTYDGTATAGSDYTAVPFTNLVFSPGQTSKTVTVPVLGDLSDEDNETFSVRIAASGAKVADAEGVCTITDNDSIPVVNIKNLGLPEGNSGTTPFNFEVTVAPVSGRTITLQYATQDSGSATAGSDYTAKSGTLTIPAGTETAIITIPVIGDPYLEAGEDFYVKLSNATNARLLQNVGRGIISNDDTKVGIFVSDVSVAEGDTAVFTITTTRAISKPATVAYTTVNGNAVAGSDYTATSGVLTIPANETSATVSVPTLNDTTPEASEYFGLNLSNPSNGVFGNSLGRATIADQDFAGVFVSDVQHLEGRDGQRALYFTVSLSTPVPFTCSVTYATSDGSATAGSDYTAVSGTLNFGPNEISKSIAVPVIGDAVAEGDETFLLNLQSPVNVVLLKPQGTATIVDDDAPLSLSINNVSLAEGNDGTTNAVFTVTLSAPTTQPVTVNFATAAGSATEGTDYTSTTGTVTLAPGQQTATISVPVIGDLANEDDETFTVTLSGAVGATIADAAGTGTITNDDAGAGFSAHKTALRVNRTPGQPVN